MLRVIVTGYDVPNEVRDKWPELGCHIFQFPIKEVVSKITQNGGQGLFCDCIVFIGREETWEDRVELSASYSSSLSRGIQLSDEIEKLSHEIAMIDGRKWNSVPVILLLREERPISLGGSALGDRVWIGKYYGIDESLDLVKQIIADYRSRVLDELDNIGIIVSYEDGRFKVGHIVSDREEADGRYYNLGADQRAKSPGKMFTVDRDVHGVTRVIEELEHLINDHETTEQQLQTFFEENPDFLPTYGKAQPLPHVELNDPVGNKLVPDFIFKPILGVNRDNNWEVFDLKKPQVKLIVKQKFHPKFSEQVNHAINQLQDYQDYFRNPENQDEIRTKLDYELRYPRAGVLIGRLPSGDELQELNLQQARNAQVRIVTYDEVLEKQIEMAP